MGGEQNWVVQDPKLESLNTCFEAGKALQVCFDETMEYKANVPIEDEFLDMQCLIGDPQT